MDILNDSTKKQLITPYQITNPFSFKVIDNFFTDETINKILENTSQLEKKNSNINSNHHKQWYEYNKYAYNKDLPPYLDYIFDCLTSNEFIDYIESLTGITGLIRNDKTLEGAGIHQIYNNGFLDIHLDFNTFQSEKHGKLDRRVNLLIYLNPEWKDEYNGHLLICDGKSKNCMFKITPFLNRAVIFNTTKDSLHGHPIPLSLPDKNMKRESIAIYYYTKNTYGDVDFEGVSKRVVTLFNHSDFNLNTATKI